jgi:hypothetical protein
MISLFRDLHPKLFLKVLFTITVFLEKICKFLFRTTYVIKVLINLGKFLT